MILDRVIVLFSDSPLERILLTGSIIMEDNGTAEFVEHNNSIYFELGNSLLELEHINSSEKVGRLRVRIADSIRHRTNELEDVTPGIIDIGKIVLAAMPPFCENRVEKMCCYNIEVSENEYYCDAIIFKLQNGQEIFLDPGWDGINIGGTEVRQIWEDNMEENEMPKGQWFEMK